MSANCGDMLCGKVAVVTGAARGIGHATAALLAEHGASVMLCDLDREATEQAAAEIGGSACAFAADLTRSDTPQALVQTAIEHFGGIDIIVNNAGYTRASRLEKMSDETWHAMLDIHVTVPFAILRAAGPHMIAAARHERAAGREVFRKVVNISSTAAQGSPFLANYGAGKAAVIGLTRSLAKEWAEHKININAVAFGAVDTRLTRLNEASNFIEIGGERVRLGLAEKVRELIVGDNPFGRYATAREAAGGVFLLCTPWSNWIHGQVLTVNGGQSGGMSV
jgi:3-oxoacyl-[acyl-carrier protein] reductase